MIALVKPGGKPLGIGATETRLLACGIDTTRGHNRHQVASEYRLRDIVMVAILQLIRAIGG